MPGKNSNENLDLNRSRKHSLSLQKSISSLKTGPTIVASLLQQTGFLVFYFPLFPRDKITWTIRIAFYYNFFISFFTLTSCQLSTGLFF
ncbi:hypothetical protein F5H01DRAFT_350711 [Linnemannia elongata]|nr:hypothetical protein F5H01DRAFT_350711 [Linnemannia elongata]